MRPAVTVEGDLNGDGLLNINDYLYWKNSLEGLLDEAIDFGAPQLVLSVGEVDLNSNDPTDLIPTIGPLSAQTMEHRRIEEARRSASQADALAKLKEFRGLAMRRRAQIIVPDRDLERYHELGEDLGLKSESERDYLISFPSLDLVSALKGIEQFIRYNEPPSGGAQQYQLLEAAVDALDDFSRAPQQRHISNEEFQRDYSPSSPSVGFANPYSIQKGAELSKQTNEAMQRQIQTTLMLNRMRPPASRPPRRS